MNRAIARNAAIVFCVLSAAGCAGTPAPDTSAAKATPAANPDLASVTLDANSDLATLTKDLPSTLEGEIRRAQLLRSKGALNEAARALAQLMLVAPDDARVVGEYGKVLAEQGHSQDSLAFLKRAVELQPHDWTLYSALGIAYDQMDKHTDAHAAYEHALSLKPGEPSVLNNYAVSRMLAGDLAGAQRLLAQASAHGTDTSKIANNLALLASMEPLPAKAVEPAATASAATASQPKAPPEATAHGAAPVVVTALSPPNPQVVMQHVPSDPRAGPVAQAHGAPHKLASAEAKPAAPTTSAPMAVAAPSAPNPRVVMQRVPVDPLAGPVAQAHRAPRKLAGAAPAKPAAPDTSAPQAPALRTAADTD